MRIDDHGHIETCVYCCCPVRDGFEHYRINYSVAGFRTAGPSELADEATCWIGEDAIFTVVKTCRGNWRLDSGFDSFDKRVIAPSKLSRLRGKRIQDFVSLLASVSPTGETVSDRLERCSI